VKAIVSLVVLAAAAAVAAPAFAAPTPKLEPNVKPPPAPLDPVTQRLVDANPTPIFSDVVVTAPPTGSLTLNQPVQALGEVHGWDWVLIGKDGVGEGYVPRSLLKPVHSYDV
jgi:hypothetical protein